MTMSLPPIDVAAEGHYQIESRQYETVVIVEILQTIMAPPTLGLD